MRKERTKEEAGAGLWALICREGVGIKRKQWERAANANFAGLGGVCGLFLSSSDGGGANLSVARFDAHLGKSLESHFNYYQVSTLKSITQQICNFHACPPLPSPFEL